MTSRLTLALLLLLVGALTLGAVPQQDSDPEGYLPYLFAAFALTWLAFFAYLFFVARKESALRREMEALRRAMDEREAKSNSPRDE